MRRLRPVATVLGALGLLAGAVAVVTARVDVPRFVVVGPASFAPILLCCTVLGMLLCLAVRRWWIAGASASVLAIAGTVVVPLYVADAAPSAGTPITLMQANVMLGEADPAALVASVRDRGVDILTAQELTPEFVDALDDAGMSDVLPYRFAMPYPGGAGAGIYSRVPVTDGRELDGYLLSSVTARVDLGTGPVRVYAVHPVPPYPTPTPVWAQEMAMLRDELRTAADSPEPVIVGGDFNATHAHARFRALLTDGWSDVGDAVGAGIVPTYPTDKSYPPLVGIDHVLVRGVGATSSTAVDIAGSDHRGLVVELALR
ncbi:endonuclease/exonuclease/phosphatase family protein [Rhodococcoides corynebacterioides]|uniref:Endonuclease/exonuclease/phosphatase family protein n=1 Tax=Rhodococcoides corynebacterioides TaxID=53972 RepID=A0ABS7P044_9NOCA|nr:endonuclease/exonuclease/phosphatase family protein [Rhodococcus corynebacterioides]MBY6365757.1 endonuclease/exonuclease/phosphatase family protein [Rhodococcus corynebacterioides]MBY6406488.1 endonuclease/exonuclease/phosphatase family protein [Rhodococcus corynebacterioides]